MAGWGLRPLPELTPTRVLLTTQLFKWTVFMAYDEEVCGCPGLLTAEFPEGWSDLLGIEFDNLGTNDMLFNRDHPIVKLATKKAMTFFRETEQLPLEKQLRVIATKDRSQFACFVLSKAGSSTEHWNALIDTFSIEMKLILESLIEETGSFRIWSCRHDGGIRIVRPQGAQFFVGDVFGGAQKHHLDLPTDRKWFFQ